MGDADITLRHVARRHPEAFTEVLGLSGDVEILGFRDTQLRVCSTITTTSTADTLAAPRGLVAALLRLLQ